MKLKQLCGLAVIVAAAVLAVPALVAAQTCALGCTPCQLPLSCAAPCGASISVFHANTDPCNSGGSFNLIGSAYENSCATGNGGCTVDIPPIRFWQYNNFRTANSGCQDLTLQPPVIANANLDFGVGVPAGHWIMLQGNWSAPGVDGCISGTPPLTLRTVAEISFNDPASGTNHGSKYMIGTVDNNNDYNFDRIQGAVGGCNAADMPLVAVPSPTLPAVTGGCINNPTPAQVTTENASDPNFFDVQVSVPASVVWNTEVGPSTGTTLIMGYELLYAGGSEPTTSDECIGGWLPVRASSNPAMENGVVATGAGTVTVALPKTGPYWLALRLVYSDTSTGINPAVSTPVAAGAGPKLVSGIGGHCGPIQFGTVAVEFDTVTAERTKDGVMVKWTTLSEEDTMGFLVYRSTSPNGLEGVERAVPFTEARGAVGGASYQGLDSSIAPNQHSDMYYYVEEVLINGAPGTRSPVVKVEGQGAQGNGVGGGRGRAGRRNR